jgi:hypothetical protein
VIGHVEYEHVRHVESNGRWSSGCGSRVRRTEESAEVFVMLELVRHVREVMVLYYMLLPPAQKVERVDGVE